MKSLVLDATKMEKKNSIAPTISHIQEKMKIYCLVEAWHMQTVLFMQRLVWNAINSMLAKQ